MGDPGVSPVHSDLTELVDDRSGRGEDVLVEDAHRQDRAVAYAEVEQLRDAGRVEVRNAGSVSLRDFPRVWDEIDWAAAPHDHPVYCAVLAGPPRSSFSLPSTTNSASGGSAMSRSSAG